MPALMALSVHNPSLLSPLTQNSCLLCSSSSQAFISLAPSCLLKATVSSRKQACSLKGNDGLVRAAAAAAHSGDDDSTANHHSVSELNGFLDRRQLLLGASSIGIAGLPSLFLPHEALSSPVQPPDLNVCSTRIDPGNGAPTVNCCLPVATTITDYKVPTNLPLRTRVSAHQVTDDYKAKYKTAYELLRQLPDSDPRQYAQQANVHCAFCDGAYVQNGTQLDYQVHNSWLFFPWHRWYLYFHERILASLIKDDTFALPFWNWDAASGYTIPPMYAADTQSSLYDANRNPNHQPPVIVDLNYSPRSGESGLTPEEQLATNNVVMYRQMVTNARTPSLFFGQPYRQGDAPSPGSGTVEGSPHGIVHIWTGNPGNPNNEDMGTLYSAGRDPIFYAHHSNLDRLWEVWKGLGGRRLDLTDTDYLNATFLFYDENANLVRVRIGDALDPANLGYNYQDVPNAWVDAAPTSTSTTTAMNPNLGPAGGPPSAMAGPIGEKLKEEVKNFKRGLKEFKEEFKGRASYKIDKPVSVLVKRPKKVHATDFEEEILVLEGVGIASDDTIKFDVYINLVDTRKVRGCNFSEYAGSFVNVSHKGMNMGGGASKVRKSNFRIGIGEVLKELEVEDEDDFAMTIVPRCEPRTPITIENVRIEYE